MKFNLNVKNVDNQTINFSLVTEDKVEVASLQAEISETNIDLGDVEVDTEFRGNHLCSLLMKSTIEWFRKRIPPHVTFSIGLVSVGTNACYCYLSAAQKTYHSITVYDPSYSPNEIPLNLKYCNYYNNISENDDPDNFFDIKNLILTYNKNE
jgi:hypothetical protein